MASGILRKWAFLKSGCSLRISPWRGRSRRRLRIRRWRLFFLVHPDLARTQFQNSHHDCMDECVEPSWVRNQRPQFPPPNPHLLPSSLFRSPPDSQVESDGARENRMSLLFLYKIVPEMPLEERIDASWAKRPERLPVVLNRDDSAVGAGTSLCRASFDGRPSLRIGPSTDGMPECVGRPEMVAVHDFTSERLIAAEFSPSLFLSRVRRSACRDVVSSASEDLRFPRYERRKRPL